PEAHARIAIGPVIFRQDILIDGAEVPRARLRMEAIPTGKPPPDDTEVGLFAAFQPRVPAPKSRGPRVDVRNARLGALDFAIEERAWSVHLPAVRARADLRYEGGDPAVEGLGLRVVPEAPLAGTLGLFGKRFAFADVRVDEFRTTRERPQDLRASLHGRIEGATATGSALLRDFFGPAASADVTVDLREAASLLNVLAASGDGSVPARLASGQPVGRIRINGPLADPAIDVEVDGILPLLGQPWVEGPVAARAHIQSGVVEVHEVRARALGAPARLNGRVDTRSGAWRAHVEIDGARTERIDPAFPGRLRGSVDLHGRIDSGDFDGTADLAVDLSQPGGLPRHTTARGQFTRQGSALLLNDFEIRAGGARVTLTGRVGLTPGDDSIALDATIDAAAPGRLLPALAGARGLHARLAIRGTRTRPRASGHATLRALAVGPIVLAFVRAPVVFDGETQTMHIDPIVGSVAGGTLHATIEIGPLRRGLPASLVLSGRIDGAELASAGIAGATGRADLRAEVSGTADALRGTAQLHAPQATLFGFSAAIEADVALDGGVVRIVRAEARQPDGGAIVASGTLDLGSRAIDLVAEATALDLARHGSAVASGTIDGRLTVAGTIDQPRLAGALRVAALALRGIGLGDGEL
ncbi:MAG: hypothetical protein AABZ30_12720, partial [Myxococcota bacterium]